MTHKIALVSAFPPGTGSLNEYGFHLAKSFALRDDVHEVVVLAEKMDKPMPELDLGPKIRVIRVWSFNNLFNVASILSALKREKADLALFNLQTATFGDRELPAALGLLAPVLARLSGQISGVLAHNIIQGVDLEQTILKGKKLRQKLVRFGGNLITRAMLAASYVTTTLDIYADILRKIQPKADISMVPHGTFDVSSRELAKISQRDQKIVTMGKFGTYKRLETLIKAFELLRNRHGFQQAKLVIGGTDHPNTPGYVFGLANAHANNPAIEFAGYVAEEAVPDFFAQAKCAVFDYTTTTGSSGVLHQCASYGTVPVFPKIDDFVELCDREGLKGGHYNPADAEALAETLANILHDDATSQAIADGNRKAVEKLPMSMIAEFHIQMMKRLKAKKAGDASHSDLPIMQFGHL